MQKHWDIQERELARYNHWHRLIQIDTDWHRFDTDSLTHVRAISTIKIKTSTYGIYISITHPGYCIGCTRWWEDWSLNYLKEGVPIPTCQRSLHAINIMMSAAETQDDIKLRQTSSDNVVPTVLAKSVHTFQSHFSKCRCAFCGALCFHHQFGYL